MKCDTKMCVFFSTPLPPLPTDKRSYLSMDNNSNRSSGSSGIYGYMSEHQTLENDDIYTKPMVLNLDNINCEWVFINNLKSVFVYLV